jgi:dTDP-4-amino-4,6-dideoxygalactose transaminase
MSLSQKPATRKPRARELFAPWPFYAKEEIDAVSQVLASGKVNYWTGQQGRLFEKEYAASIRCGHAVAVMNGTVALELALHALEVPAGSEVITSPRTFVASASCIVAHGCIPILADVDPDSGNITADTVAKVITAKTSAIIPVHLGGLPCDMDPIMDLARKYGLKVIEDCAQASGAAYKGRAVGSIGDAGAFSFCQDKIITTGGEGGLLTTNDPDVWKKAWEYKDHGKSWEAVYNRAHAPGFRWLHESFGTNWRMTEMQAAIGRIQLAKLPEWSAKRRENMGFLMDKLAMLPAFRVPTFPEAREQGAYKAYAYVRPERLAVGWDRDRIMTEITNLGVPCFSGSCSEIYRERAFTDAGFGPAQPLEAARKLGETSLLFLVHPTLTETNLIDTAEITAQVVNMASI